MDICPNRFTNAAISEFLENISIAYIINNKTRFQIAAYQNAAETVSTYPKSVYELWQQDPKKIDQIPGIGQGIIKKLAYLFSRNKLYPSLRPLFRRLHPAVFVFAKINGIGPKTAHLLTQNLRFSQDPSQSLNQLVDYAQKHRLRHLDRLGDRSEEQILNNTLAFLGRKKRLTLAQADKIALKIINYLKAKFPQTKIVPLGSLRRRAATIGDIDIAVASNQPEAVIDHFVHYPHSLQLINRGHKKASIRIKNDIHLDLMVEPQKYWGSLLIHFTGSKMHNIILRKYALSLGYSVSEYGIMDLKTKIRHTFKTEKSFYNFLKLCPIDPENRLGKDEIVQAQKCYNQLLGIKSK